MLFLAYSLNHGTHTLFNISLMNHSNSFLLLRPYIVWPLPYTLSIQDFFFFVNWYMIFNWSSNTSITTWVGYAPLPEQDGRFPVQPVIWQGVEAKLRKATHIKLFRWQFGYTCIISEPCKEGLSSSHILPLFSFLFSPVSLWYHLKKFFCLHFMQTSICFLPFYLLGLVWPSKKSFHVVSTLT